MIGPERVVAIIPARAGSKSVPDKNLKKVGGKSLVRRAVETASRVAEIDQVLVSTDGPKIAEEAQRAGAEIVARPAELAGDTSLIKDVLLDIFRSRQAMGEAIGVMVLLEPTACLREPGDVRTCLSRLHEENLDSIATFTEADPNPYRTWRIEEGRPYTFIAGTVPWQNRQTLPPAYRLNGAVYAFRADGLTRFQTPGLLFGRSGAVLMPPERSVDIDSAIDLDVANAVYNKLYPQG